MEQLRAIARDAAIRKYRHAKWDADHPEISIVDEIGETIEAFLVESIAKLRELQSNHSPEELATEPSFSETTGTTVTHRGQYKERLRFRAVWGVFNNKCKLVETFPFGEREAAVAMAERLRKDHRAEYYVARTTDVMPASESGE